MSEEASTSLAHYQVITTLGQGGMARVLLTLSRGPAGVDKLLVVKELKAELKGDPDFLTMFLDEARIAARLNHPNVIQTYEVSSDGEHPLIVMEYLEGQSLSALLGRVGRKAMPLEIHVHVLSQTAAGLHYAHELRAFDGSPLDVVHRDVSPHNVFVTYDGLVKLVDFGIAKAAGSAGVTQAGQFKGKLGYASPEQLGGGFEGRAVDRRTDVFALGVMLWEAVARRRLTMGEEQGRVMNRRLRGEDPRLTDVVPDAPPALARICEKAMAFDPEDRFPTAADLRAALEEWLDEQERTGSGDLAALVQSTFAEDREKIRGIVETRIREIAAGAPQPDLTPFSRRALPRPPISELSLPTAAAGGGAPVAPQSQPSEATMRAAASPALQAPPAERERSFGRVLVGVGVAVAVALTALQLTRGGGASAAADLASSAPPAGAVPAPAATVVVSISADPPEARVFLDDEALGSNPFNGAMPRSALVHRIRATAPGYASEQRIVVLDRDLRLELALKPAPAAPSTTAGASPPPPGRTIGAAPPAAGTTAAKAPTSPAPGEALTNPTRKTPRPIDTAF